MAEQQMKVAANLQQDFTTSQKAQARKNIDAADNKGFVTCYLPFSDSSWSDIWYKLCEVDPGQSNSYSYHYELALKLVCTNNGSGDCPAESATIDIGCNFIPRLNTGRCECTFADHTVSDHDQQTILGIKILTHRASSNYGPRDKAEVWVKCSKYFTSETQMRVECLMNSGAQFYRSNYSTPTAYTLPWTFRNTNITGTHTDPFDDADHPAAQGYGAEGWSEVWYPAETKTVMVDHPQTFTDTEKETARTNIGAADGKIPWVEYHDPQPQPTINMSGLSVVTSDSGSRIQNDDASLQYYVAPPPASGDTGKVLGVNSIGKVTWINVPNPGKDYDMYIARSISTPTSVFTKEIGMIDEQGTHKDFFGMLGFTTPSTDSFALVPYDADGNLVYGAQSVNITAPATGVVNFVPFMFHADNPGEIRNICLKGGTQESTAAITHLQVIQRK